MALSFDWLLDPIEPTTFFGEFYERKPLLIERRQPRKFAALLSIEAIDRYLSTMSVKSDGSGGSIVTWVGQFSRKNPRANAPEAEGDAAVLGLITGAYQGGLQNLKKLME